MSEFEEATKIWEIIKEKDRILIPLHLSPDGDSIASALAFAAVLEDLNKEVVLSSTDLVAGFDFLPNFSCIQHKDLADFDLTLFDLILFLDSSHTSDGVTLRHTTCQISLPEDTAKILIDHHPHFEKYPDFDAFILNKQAASTTEILYQLFCKWNVEIGKDLGTILLVGLLTDTGFFRFTNTSATTLRIAGELLERGVVYDQILFHLLRQVSPSSLALWSIILGNVSIDEDLGVMLSTVSFGEFKPLDISEAEFNQARGSALAMFFQQVQGTRVGVLLTEVEYGEVRGSLRTRTGFDVSKIAKVLGGAGHKLAAGFSLEMGLKAARKKVWEVLHCCMDDNVSKS